MAVAPGPLGFGKLEAVFDNLAGSVTMPFVVPYAVSLGANGWQVGLLTASTLLASSVSQIPAARWGPRFGRPRAYLWLAGGSGSLAWLSLALLLLSGQADPLRLFLLANAASISLGLVTPMWTSFLGEQVPEERRGSYFGNRSSLGGVAALGGAFSAASLGSIMGFGPGNGVALMVGALASFGGVGAMAMAFTVAAAPRFPARQSPTEGGSGAWRTPIVRDFVIYGALLILGAGMATPFYSVRFINELQGAPQMATTAIATANALVMLGQGLFGRVIDHFGFRLLGGTSLAGVALVPLLWLAATEPPQGVSIWLLNGLMWSACGLATFTLMLAVSNNANRAMVVAWVNSLQAPVNFGAPLIGGLLAERAGLVVLFPIASAVLATSLVYFLRSFPAGGREGVPFRPG